MIAVGTPVKVNSRYPNDKARGMKGEVASENRNGYYDVKIERTDRKNVRGWSTMLFLEHELDKLDG